MANPITDEMASAYGRTGIRTNVHLDWEQVSPDYGDTLLRSTIHIGGVPHHVQATSVHHENDRQVADDPALDLNLEALYEHAEPDGPFETVHIGDRDYVVSIYPFS